MADIDLRSPAFADRQPVPGRYAGDQANLSPPLEWSGVPANATELVLMCEDPDAPSGTFLHWLVTGIDPGASGVAEGENPPGGQAWPNGFGRRGWGGPQPPPGRPHRYLFHLYALDHAVRLPSRPTAADVHRVVEGAALASGTTVGTYHR